MALEGEVLSGDLYLKFSTDGGSTFDTVGVMRSVQLNYSFPTIEVSSQGSGGFVTRKPGKRKSLSGTVNSLVVFVDASGELNADDHITLGINGTLVPFTYEASSPAAGDITLSGTAIISGGTIGGGDDGEATASFNFDSTGNFAVVVTT